MHLQRRSFRYPNSGKWQRALMQKIIYGKRSRFLAVMLNTLSTKKGFREPKKKSGTCCSMVSGKPVNLKMNKSATYLGLVILG